MSLAGAFICDPGNHTLLPPQTFFEIRYLQLAGSLSFSANENCKLTITYKFDINFSFFVNLLFSTHLKEKKIQYSYLSYPGDIQNPLPTLPIQKKEIDGETKKRKENMPVYVKSLSQWQ